MNTGILQGVVVAATPTVETCPVFIWHLEGICVTVSDTLSAIGGTVVIGSKDWDGYVTSAEEVARTAGFVDLRDRIIALAEPAPTDQAIDIGAGTGLLTLALADRVNHVWAIDISRRMCDYLQVKAHSADTTNVGVAVASAESLPLVDQCADLVVSNYCFHHLSAEGKQRALAETFRVLRPGGRLVFADMMFNLRPATRRDTQIILAKSRALLRKGPSGVARLGRIALRTMVGQGESPARVDWWERAIVAAGFVDVAVAPLAHEGGVACARRPAGHPALGGGVASDAQPALNR